MFTNFFPNPLNNSLLIDEAKRVKSHYENNPNDLQFILHQNPEFAQAVLSDDISVLTQHIYKQKMEETQKKMQELERISKLNDDPFNSENQRMIEEEIKKKNIQENL